MLALIPRKAEQLPQTPRRPACVWSTAGEHMRHPLDPATR